jgi:hypothetical protein
VLCCVVLCYVMVFEETFDVSGDFSASFIFRVEMKKVKLLQKDVLLHLNYITFLGQSFNEIESTCQRRH